jgi:lantibiotic modifying enzyme
MSWYIRIGGDEVQTGFSHGASGIALSLLDLYRVIGDERLRETARGAFEFEREYFWREMSRWLGDEGPKPASSANPAAAAEKSLAVTWCYGAPGVGMARLKALQLLQAPSLEEELRQCVEVTLRHGFGKNHSLCHGDLGNLDLLHETWRVRHDARLAGEVARLSRSILASLEKNGPRCGTVGEIEAPGLMNGLAGIGYGLLRLAAPEVVPSVLMMEPPRS